MRSEVSLAEVIVKMNHEGLQSLAAHMQGGLGLVRKYMQASLSAVAQAYGRGQCVRRHFCCPLQ